MFRSARGRVFLGIIAGLASLGTLVAVLQRYVGYYNNDSALRALKVQEQSDSPQLESPEDSAAGEPKVQLDSSTASRQDSKLLSDAQPGFVGQLDLIVPVAGVEPSGLLDTFSDARYEGRVHDAIDIPPRRELRCWLLPTAKS